MKQIFSKPTRNSIKYAMKLYILGAVQNGRSVEEAIDEAVDCLFGRQTRQVRKEPK